MEAVQYSTEEQKLELVELDKPSVTEPDDVLIRVLISGISKQDLHIIYDLIPCKPDEPLILGHEFCGIVFDVGCDVKTISKGNKVVVNPNRKCGICVCCRTGTPQYCTNTSQTIGHKQKINK